MPAKVGWAVAGLWFETALFVLAVADLFVTAHGRSSHGQSGVGQTVVAGVFLVPVAALWGGCAVAAARRAYWVRVPVLCLQAFFVFGGLVALVVALAVQDVIGIAVAVVFLALPAAVAWLSLTPAAREWFRR
ncbi:hypothetical protein [Actinoallomurus iriomotensis]|uniref:Uncharacterized protein n=1 Tax=Actinoallomurus iriomotensis TaxID=478107 RepID=A0A9W6S8A3_9ACTN|nr:hypothetical protein [Actinoallomurus iriomotensis]GLY87537.1 hypothetical protein Airi02_054660 [Actinoallomurus iriomotensis]